MGKYELIEHTADVMVKCTGNSLEECFENAAYAMFDQVVNAELIEPINEYSVEITGNDNEEKLYAFLSELLFILDCDGVAMCEFKVKIQGDKVSCVAKGENLDVVKHKAKSEIKAVTYHMLTVDPDVPYLTVIFDV